MTKVKNAFGNLFGQLLINIMLDDKRSLRHKVLVRKRTWQAGGGFISDVFRYKIRKMVKNKELHHNGTGKKCSYKGEE